MPTPPQNGGIDIFWALITFRPILKFGSFFAVFGRFSLSTDTKLKVPFYMHSDQRVEENKPALE